MLAGEVWHSLSEHPVSPCALPDAADPFARMTARFRRKWLLAAIAALRQTRVRTVRAPDGLTKPRRPPLPYLILVLTGGTRYTEPEPELNLLLTKLKLELPAQPPPKITAAPASPTPL
jgi:hypothetical protein